MTTTTLDDLCSRAGREVYDHLDRAADVPVTTLPWPQGDVLLVPATHDTFDGIPKLMPAAPVEVLVSASHDHSLVCDGLVTIGRVTDDEHVVAVVDIPEGAAAWVLHDEHGGIGLAVGRWVVRHQIEGSEQARRRVAD